MQKPEPNSNGDPPQRTLLSIVWTYVKDAFSFMGFLREIWESASRFRETLAWAISFFVLGGVGAPHERIVVLPEKPAALAPNFDYPNTVFGNQSGTITTDPALTNKTRRAEPSTQITTGSLGNQNKAGAKKATPEAGVASTEDQIPLTEKIAQKVSNCFWGIFRVFVPKHEDAKPTA